MPRDLNVPNLRLDRYSRVNKKEVLNLVERGHAFLDAVLISGEKRTIGMSKLLRLGEIKKEKKCMSSSHDYPPIRFHCIVILENRLCFCIAKPKLKKNGNPRESYTSCLPPVER